MGWPPHSEPNRYHSPEEPNEKDHSPGPDLRTYITASITIPAAYVMWGIYSQTIKPSTQSDKPPHEIVIRYMWNRAPQPHHTTEEATSDSCTKDTPTPPSKATALTANSKQTRKIHPSAITEQHQLNQYTVTLFRNPYPPQYPSSNEDEASTERAVAPEQTQRPAIRIATYAEILSEVLSDA